MVKSRKLHNLCSMRDGSTDKPIFDVGQKREAVLRTFTQKWCEADASDYETADKFLQEYDEIAFFVPPDIIDQVLARSKRPKVLDNYGISGYAMLVMLQNTHFLKAASLFLGHAVGCDAECSKWEVTGYVRAKRRLCKQRRGAGHFEDAMDAANRHGYDQLEACRRFGCNSVHKT